MMLDPGTALPPNGTRAWTIFHQAPIPNGFSCPRNDNDNDNNNIVDIVFHRDVTLFRSLR